jgi:hypothetical protein
MSAQQFVSITVTVPLERWEALDGCLVATVLGEVREALEGSSRFVTRHPGVLVSLVGESIPYDEESTYRSALRLGGQRESDGPLDAYLGQRA